VSVFLSYNYRFYLFSQHFILNTLERISIVVVLGLFCSTFGLQKLVQHSVTNQSKDAVFFNQVVHNPAKPIVLLAASFSRA